MATVKTALIGGVWRKAVCVLCGVMERLCGVMERNFSRKVLLELYGQRGDVSRQSPWLESFICKEYLGGWDRRRPYACLWEDPNSVSRTHLKKQKPDVCIIPVLGRWRLESPWGSMANRSWPTWSVTEALISTCMHNIQVYLHTFSPWPRTVSWSLLI